MVQNLDYANVKIPQYIQGESFRKVITGEEKNWRDAIYYTYYEYPGAHNVKRHYGVHTDRYKLIHFYYNNDEWELYDLEKDPSEMRNIYNDNSYTVVREQMHKKLTKIRNKYGDSEALEQELIQTYFE